MQKTDPRKTLRRRPVDEAEDQILPNRRKKGREGGWGERGPREMVTPVARVPYPERSSSSRKSLGVTDMKGGR